MGFALRCAGDAYDSGSAERGDRTTMLPDCLPLPTGPLLLLLGPENTTAFIASMPFLSFCRQQQQ